MGTTRALLYTLSIFVTMAPLTIACDHKVNPPTVASVSGTYVGSYCGVQDVFTFKSDGTYQQVISSSPDKKNRGSWRIEQPDQIEFTDLITVMSLDGSCTMKKITGANGTWVLRSSTGQIIFDDDHRYWIVKQEPVKGATDTDKVSS